MIGFDTIPLLTANALASGSTGDKATLKVPPGKWEVERAFVVWEGVSAHATAAIVKLDKRPTAGSDTDRGDGDIAVLKKVASVAQQGKMTYAIPAAHTFVKGGEEIVVEVTTAQGEALAFAAGVNLKASPESVVNLTNEVLTA